LTVTDWAILFVVDSSAIVSIILMEPEGAAFFDAMGRQRVSVSALIVFESETVVRSRKGVEAVAEVRALLAYHRVKIVPFDDAQAAAANEAYSRFGKGIHPAGLNLCDCASYALAKSLDAPLLYKGDDFARTDIVSAVTVG